MLPPTGWGAEPVGTYAFHRLLWAFPTLLGVATLVFLMIHLVPGDPVEAMLGEYAAPSAREELRAQLGLDKPLPEQYLSFMAGIAVGDFGRSVALEGRPQVAAVIAEAFPTTLLLALAAMAVALIIALPAGMISAARRNSLSDYTLSTAALLGISIPNFWLGPLLILLFSIQLGWLPVSGLDTPAGLVLPALTLGTSLAAALTRMVRAAMSEEMAQDYIRTARARGLPEWRVVGVHALRNSLIPVVSVAGLQFGALLAGAVVTERIFSIRGIGFILIDSIGRRDYPMVQGAILVIAFCYIAVNLATDLLYALIDPRVRFGR
jgi:peptide/nickel transport system permease protein